MAQRQIVTSDRFCVFTLTVLLVLSLLLVPTSAWIIQYPPVQLKIGSPSNNNVTTTTSRTQDVTTTTRISRDGISNFCFLPPVDQDAPDLETERCDPTTKSPIDMYSYSNRTGKCQQYVYNGCWGTQNLFLTEDACRQTCENVH